MDTKFSNVLIHPQQYIEEFIKWPAVIPPDCSTYRDAPPWTQLFNIIRSRIIGSYYQRHGVNIYPLCRWGDETTYTSCLYGEKPAFLGLPHKSPIVISNYGCLKSYEDKFHFRKGLTAMIDELNPSTVFVYGSFNHQVFANLNKRTKFIHFENWTKRMHKGGEQIG